MQYNFLLEEFIERNHVSLHPDADFLFVTNDENIEYPCSEYTKSTHFHFLHKLVSMMDIYPILYDFLVEIIPYLTWFDINVQNEEGWTPLMIVCRKSYEAVKLLLEYGAYIDMITIHKDNVLSIAVQSVKKYNNINTVKLLLDNKPDINLQDIYGNNSLLRSLRRIDNISYFDVPKLLIEHGADVHTKDMYGNTLLLRVCHKIGDQICGSIDIENKLYGIDVVEFLLDHKININAQNKTGFTALMKASSYGFDTENENIVELLLLNGADPNLKNNRGNTALFETIKNLRRSSVRTVELLLMYGSDVNITNNKNFTCVRYLMSKNKMIPSNIIIQVVLLLIKYGFDVNKKIYNEKSLLELSTPYWSCKLKQKMNEMTLLKIKEIYHSGLHECIVCSNHVISIKCGFNHTTCYSCLSKNKNKCLGCQLYLLK